MKEKGEIAKAISLGLGGLIGYFSGLDWELLIIYLFLMILDTLNAVVYSCESGKYVSKKNQIGLYGKIAEFFSLIALILGQRVLEKVGIPIPFSPAFITLFIFKEIGSILETISVNGGKLPAPVIKWFDESIKVLNNEEVKNNEDR